MAYLKPSMNTDQSSSSTVEERNSRKEENLNPVQFHVHKQTNKTTIHFIIISCILYHNSIKTHGLDKKTFLEDIITWKQVFETTISILRLVIDFSRAAFVSSSDKNDIDLNLGLQCTQDHGCPQKTVLRVLNMVLIAVL
jgi:hypothetical protein